MISSQAKPTIRLPEPKRSDHQRVDALPFIRIEACKNSGLGLRELWEYRELLYFLVWRDVKVRYKQTAIGASWAVLSPLLTVLIFAVVFGKLAKISSDG